MIKSKLLLVIIRPILSVSILHTLDSSNNNKLLGNYYLCNTDMYARWLSKLRDVCENVYPRGKKRAKLKDNRSK